MKNKILLFLSILVITMGARSQNIPGNYMVAPQDTISLYQQSADSLFQYLAATDPISLFSDFFADSFPATRS